jgi:hypothetical protein
MKEKMETKEAKMKRVGVDAAREECLLTPLNFASRLDCPVTANQPHLDIRIAFKQWSIGAGNASGVQNVNDKFVRHF